MNISQNLTASLLIFSSVCLINCSPEPLVDEDEGIMAGGETTTFQVFSNAFQEPAANLSAVQNNLHIEGDRAFEAAFVTAPAVNNGGLGPLFNQNACNSCHIKNGRAQHPDNPAELGGLLLRLSSTGATANNEPLPLAGFGGQLQTKSTLNATPEGKVNINYQPIIGQFDDGEYYELRKPIYTISNTYMLLPSNALLSPRIAPPVFGLGLLEAIPEGAILAKADETDSDNDGISGKPNYVWNKIKMMRVLGRFGWKANQPDLLQQTYEAFNGDMGVTSSFEPTENCAGQPQHDGRNDDPEVTDLTIKNATFYTQSLAVPARRNTKKEEVIKGKKLFNEINCKGCHIAKWQTGTHPEHNFLSNQTIYPYTDLLLHDLGNDLADGRTDFLANGKEWRTPPLWGIGLTRLVNGHTHFLHDGRARSLQEAILWHGGEAEFSKKSYLRLSKKDRNAVISFLESL